MHLSSNSFKDQGNSTKCIYINLGCKSQYGRQSFGLGEKYTWLFEVRIFQKSLAMKSFQVAWSTINSNDIDKIG